MTDERTLTLVRLRLLVPGALSETKLADSLLAYVDADEPWPERWRAMLERLSREGELTREPLALTALGRERALTAIGLDALPKRASFKGLVRQHVVPRALGLTSERAQKRVQTADGLRAAVLAGGEATLQQAVDALVWKALGMPADGPLSLGKLRERVLARELGRPMPLARAVRLAAAQAAGARRTEPDALAEAVVRRWAAEASKASVEPADALRRFAQDVLTWARDPSTRRFTDEKAFIDAVWQRASQARAIELAEFKALLLEAHRRGLLVLSRADLTQLIPPEQLAASAIELDGAAFHFVRTDAPEVSS
jgi:hypothetical protein